MRISDWSSDVCSPDLGADASGPLSFMDVWDAMCRTIMSAGSRRGAMMATLSCDHPDIEAFVAAKQEPGRVPIHPGILRLIAVRDRKSVVSGKSGSVLVDLGVRRNIKKKKKTEK